MENNKQQTAMKLYTEEQVREMLEICIDIDLYEHILTFEDILKTQNHIELPSDDEIDEESPYVPDDASIDFWSHKEGFVDGAKWMRNKIQGGKQ
jgi:hypothetical protein